MDFSLIFQVIEIFWELILWKQVKINRKTNQRISKIALLSRTDFNDLYFYC